LVLAYIRVNRNYIFLGEVRRVLKMDGWLVISDSYWRGQEGRRNKFKSEKPIKNL